MRRRDLCLWFVLLAQAFSATAQVLNIEKERVQLAELDGLWRFHTGDDPAWASPGFDDSKWPLVAPTAPWTIPKPAPSAITGWYRLRITLPDTPEPFSLLLPPLPTSYQVFANAREFGHFGSPAGLVRSPVPRLFEIPADISRSRTVVLSVRVQYQPHFVWYAGPPGFHGIPILGSASQTTARFNLERLAAVHKEISAFFVAFLCLQVTAVSWLFYLLRPSDREYMWLAIYALANAVNFGLLASLPLMAWPLMPAGLFLGLLNVVFEVSEFLIVASLLAPAGHSQVHPAGEREGRRNRSYLPKYPWILVVVAAILIAAANGMLVIDGGRSGLWNNIQSTLFFAVLISFLWLILTSAGRDRLRAWIIFAALTCVFSYFIVLNFVATFPFVSRPLKDFTLGSFRSLIQSPFPVGCWELIGFVIVASLFAVILERFLKARREEERMESEIEAARLVQQVLVPAETPLIPGFHIESVYRPAGQVGGDFFQVLSTPGGAALIVIGDVSGKGMPAAMTVSLLVGTFRTLAHYTQSPGEILTAMNRRISNQSAQKIADAAQSFGQEDDITVLTLSRVASGSAFEAIPIV